MMTALYNDKKLKANTADMLGKIAITEFLDPPNKRQCESTIVVIQNFWIFWLEWKMIL